MEAVLCSKKRTNDCLWVINEVHVQTFVKRICRYVFNDSKSTGLRPDRNDYELNVQEEIQKVCTPKTR